MDLYSVLISWIVSPASFNFFISPSVLYHLLNKINADIAAAINLAFDIVAFVAITVPSSTTIAFVLPETMLAVNRLHDLNDF